MPRDEFSPHVKSVLARRAGYLCSICEKLTVGPSEEGELAVNLTGVAAHITAAAPGPGARRYDANLNPEQRSSIDNGIWLCATHADLIDGDEIYFTTSYLKNTKKNHEDKITLKHSGINVDKGIITKIQLSNLGEITNPISLELRDLNIIRGKNGTGKSLICELISSLANKKYLKRWTNRKRTVNGYCKINYFKNKADEFTISIDNHNNINYLFNDNPIPLLVAPLSIFYIKEGYYDFLRELSHEEKDIPTIFLIAQYLNLTKDELVNIITNIARDKKVFINDITIDIEDGEEELFVKLDAKSPILPFGALSGGEQDRVFLEIILKLANYYSKFNTTILIIEKTSLTSLDSAGVNHLLQTIRNENVNFQFIFTTVGTVPFDFSGYTVFDLKITNDVISVVKSSPV